MWVPLVRGFAPIPYAMHLQVTDSTLEISIPPSVVQFLESYQEAHDLPTKHAVIFEALMALQRSELERAYAGAPLDVDAAWDETTADGLTEFQDEIE